MDVALDSLRANHDTGEVSAALSLMQVYIDNIVKDPKNEKFRKIRISNPRFNATIWQLEPARTFLLLCGFEEQEGFLVVPSQVSLEGAKTLIDGMIRAPANPGADPTPVRTAQATSVLKLGEAQSASFLAPDVKADLTLLSYMKDMGYDLKLAEKALMATKNAGVQPAMDWIAAHPDAAVGEIHPPVHSTESSGQLLASGGNQTAVAAPVSRYQKTAQQRHKFQERQRQEAIEAARLEKQQKKLQKHYLLQEMKGEKEAKKELNELAKRVRSCGEATESMATTASSAVSDQRHSAETCAEGHIELRIRLPDGKASILSLPSESPIDALYQHICQTSGLGEDEFVLKMNSFPHVELSRTGASLAQSGLSSRATLVVTRRDQQGVVTQGQGAVVRVRNINSLDDWQDAVGRATDELVVVMFHTSWCAASRSVSDAYETLVGLYRGSSGSADRPVHLVRVDVDKLKILKYQHRVTTTPTFKLFWNEKVLGEVVGADLDKVREVIEANRAGPKSAEGEEERVENAEEFHDPR